MKSWITYLLPNDEYKEKRILYFFSEGAIILFLSLVGMIICNKFFTISLKVELLIPVVIFLLYVSGRYILSGNEYTDIATESSYKRELRSIVVKTSSFVILFLLLYVIYFGFPNTINEWTEIFALLVGIALFWFLASYISLKLSYNKNKELL